MQQWWDKIEEFWPFISSGLRVPLIVIGALIVTRILRVISKRIQSEIVRRMKPRFVGPQVELDKRAETVGGILYKTASIAIWVFALMMALTELGFEIGPILAGAGIAGLAFGFGAQNIVRDVISGLFMIVENQVRVGDVAVINGTGGLVEQVNLRTTVLRSLDGTVHVFPNGIVNTLSNMTRDFSFYVFDMGVAYKEDTDRVCEVMKEVAAGFVEEPEWRDAVLEPLEILGVDKFADSAVIVKARIKTEPIKQWAVGRELNRRFKKKFDELGIEIPFPHRSVYWGEASKPIELRSTPDRDAIRETVRQVLVELKEAPAGKEV